MMYAPSLANKQRNLPSVDAIVRSSEGSALMADHGRDLVVYAIRQSIDQLRRTIIKNDSDAMVTNAMVIALVQKTVAAVTTPSLRPVINATGVILHTNLGRAPLGKAVLDELTPIVLGYSNLEFDLATAQRGSRGTHIATLITCLTGAQDALVVNNNAAALILALHTLAQNQEVIISRGELIEIGGAFRIPEIMAASGARMVEVGTTNRTRSSDYEQAITPNTALIFKAHKSNYTIAGFTEEVSVAELASLARAHRLPFIYDIGSGLIRKPKIAGMADEPDVRSALSQGADLVMFSGDKLLGGPQSGIIAGKKELVAKCGKSPLMRALRVGKLTLAALSTACRQYLNDAALIENNPLFALLERPVETRRALAEKLCILCQEKAIPVEVVTSFGQCGGGTLADFKLASFAVALVPPTGSKREKAAGAEMVFNQLLHGSLPVLGVLREGRFMLDVTALFEEQLDPLAAAFGAAFSAEALCGR